LFLFDRLVFGGKELPSKIWMSRPKVGQKKEESTVLAIILNKCFEKYFVCGPLAQLKLLMGDDNCAKLSPKLKQFCLLLFLTA